MLWKHFDWFGKLAVRVEGGGRSGSSGTYHTWLLNRLICRWVARQWLVECYKCCVGSVHTHCVRRFFILQDSLSFLLCTEWCEHSAVKSRKVPPFHSTCTFPFPFFHRHFHFSFHFCFHPTCTQRALFPRVDFSENPPLSINSCQRALWVHFGCTFPRGCPAK